MLNEHLLARIAPMIESNMNICELGPRSTGKSHIYKELSPNSILLSGGQTTVANLFYNMSRRTVGLVGMWDTIAFDEVAGINFKDKDGVQIMKDYMNSGSFVRGKGSIIAKASMVFEGNINQSVESLLKTSTYNFTPSAISITLPVIEDYSLSLNEAKVIDSIKDNYLYSRSDIEKLSGFTKDKLIRLLASLQEKGLIEKSGKGRATYYKKK